MDSLLSIDYKPDLDLNLGLDVESAESDELFDFRPKVKAHPDRDYRASEQQLIQEGKLGDSEFSARIKRVTHGTFKAKPACLILFRVDFCPKGGGRGWFRFRNATVQVEFSDVVQTSDGQTSFQSDDDEPLGPLVLKFYPELIRGHVQTAAQRYNIEGYVEPAAAGLGVRIGAQKTFANEGLHLVHGRLFGDPETGVKWTVTENTVTSSGIYEQPTFALIVETDLEKRFAMKLTVRATTYAGRVIKGQRKPRVIFTGGSLSDNEILDEIDLEERTQMRVSLLGSEGPGAGRTIFTDS